MRHACLWLRVRHPLALSLQLARETLWLLFWMETHHLTQQLVAPLLCSGLLSNLQGTRIDPTWPCSHVEHFPTA